MHVIREEFIASRVTEARLPADMDHIQRASERNDPAVLAAVLATGLLSSRSRTTLKPLPGGSFEGT